jgi:hypothetical protein
VKRRENATGLRQLLLDDHRLSLDRWRISGHVDERERALESGESETVSSARLMCALMHAGMDYRPYAFGGVHADKLFALDEHDRLTELRDE